MAGISAERPDVWMRVDDLKKALDAFPEDSFVQTNTLGNLGVSRGDDRRPTWEGMLGWIDLLIEAPVISPVTTDEDWPEIRDSPIFLGEDEWVEE